MTISKKKVTKLKSIKRCKWRQFSPQIWQIQESIAIYETKIRTEMEPREGMPEAKIIPSAWKTKNK